MKMYLVRVFSGSTMKDYIAFLNKVLTYEEWLETNVGPRYYKYRIFGLGFIKTWTWYRNTDLVFYNETDVLAFKLRFGI